MDRSFGLSQLGPNYRFPRADRLFECRYAIAAEASGCTRQGIDLTPGLLYFFGLFVDVVPHCCDLGFEHSREGAVGGVEKTHAVQVGFMETLLQRGDIRGERFVPSDGVLSVIEEVL